MTSGAIYGQNDKTVREAVQALAGLNNITLLASTTQAGAGTNQTGPVLILPHDGFRLAAFVLKLTNAATDSNDTLDVYIDTSLDAGTTWINIVHFTQILGNGADTLNFAAVSNTAIAGDEFAVTSDVAAGGTPRAFVGNQLRARWTVVDPTGTNATFTFSIVASFKP